MHVLLLKLLAALEANYKWHQGYVEYEGYPDRELCSQNEDAIRGVKECLVRYPKEQCDASSDQPTEGQGRSREAANGER